MTAESKTEGKEIVENVVFLTALVLSRTNSRNEDNNFEWSHYPNDDHETGSSWVNCEIEVSLLLTDTPQNKFFSLQKLHTLGHSNMRDSYSYQEYVEERYHQQVEALTPGSTVEISINTSRFRRDNTYICKVGSSEQLEIEPNNVNAMFEVTELGTKTDYVDIHLLTQKPQV